MDIHAAASPSSTIAAAVSDPPQDPLQSPGWAHRQPLLVDLQNGSLRLPESGREALKAWHESGAAELTEILGHAEGWAGAGEG